LSYLQRFLNIFFKEYFSNCYIYINETKIKSNRINKKVHVFIMKKIILFLIISALMFVSSNSYSIHSISPFSNLYFCGSVYPTAYQNTVLFTLNEGIVSDFAKQTNQTIILTLPAGFEFNTAAGPTVTYTAARNITALTCVWTTTAITITITTGGTNKLDAIQFNNFWIRATAAGSGDLMRLSPSVGTFTIEGSVDIPGDGVPNPAESFGHLLAGLPMTYNWSSVAQYTTDSINRNCTYSTNPILEIQINVTDIAGCAAIVSQFDFSTSGDAGYSQNPLTNITSASVYYTGQTQGFTTNSLFGTFNTPNGAFTITGSKQLSLGTGTYYFYLSYNVPNTANINERLDASMISFVIDGSTKLDMLTPNPAGTRKIIDANCPQPDLPNPPANLQTVTAGSLVIPMDNAHQNLFNGYPFNIKAYGLVNALLMNDIPVKWVIKSGKAKDVIDFSAIAARIYPSFVAAALQDFRASAFVIDSVWINKPFYTGWQTATQVITAFAQWKVAVYQLSNNEVVDIRYTLNARPKIAVFNNGGNQILQTTLLDSAKITNYVAISTGLFTGLADCYTFCSEAHWAGTIADTTITKSVRDFVDIGGNFLAQCKGIDTYENNQGTYHFHTTNGVTILNNVIANAYYNVDLAFNQFEGSVIANPGGSEQNWTLNGGTWVPSFYPTITSSTNIDNIFTGGAHLTSPDSIGSNVFYLGGHSYLGNWTNILYINAIRTYLNAALVPAHRPTAFLLDPGPNKIICEGQSTTLGGAPTGPASPPCIYVWTPSAELNDPSLANPVATPTVTTVYTVTANNNGCLGGPSYVTVTVVPTPAAPVAASNSPLCAGQTLNLTASDIPGATYEWTGPNSFSSSIQNPSIPNATIAASGIYSVIATVDGCPSLAGTVTVTVTDVPAAPMAGSNSPLCVGQTLNLIASFIAGATYNWTGPNGFSSSLQNPSVPGITLADAGDYSVTATVDGCTGTAGTTTVVVNPIPAAPIAGNNGPLCEGATLNLTASNIAGATYSWTGPNGFTSSLQNPVIVIVTLADAGNYSVTATVDGCTSIAGTTIVVVDPIPAAPIVGNNGPLCEGQTLNLTASDVPGATYSWTGPNGFSSSLQNPSIPNVTLAELGDYSVTVTVNGCTSM